MLNGAVNVLDYVMEDYMVLANYIKGFENGIVKADNSPLLEKYPNLLIDYSSVNGSGRIEILEKNEGAVEDEKPDEMPKTGDDGNILLQLMLMCLSVVALLYTINDNRTFNKI